MRRSWRPALSARTKILAWILLVVALASATTVLVTGRALFSMNEGRAYAELTHEAEKFHAFAQAPDPSTGTRFGSIEQLLTSYLTHSMAESSETFFSILDGDPHLRSRTPPLLRLDTDPAFVAQAAGATRPSYGHLATDVGPIVFAVIPVEQSAPRSDGALVIVEFLGPEQAEDRSTLLIMSVISLFALALAGTTGWLVAGHVLAPIRDVRQTAATISDTDLSRRISVRGNDDVAQLARTFNHMLDRLEEAFDGQRRFLDDAGHELRTPITIIRGHLDVMGDDPEEREQTMRLVDDELRRMSRLIDDLVLLARSERPDFLVPGRVILSDLVVDTLTKATALADRRWSISALADRTVVADGQRLAQALLQLVSNAAQHTEPGDTITLGSEVVGERVRLWVADTGTGIAPEDLDRIFRRFDRGSHPATTTGSGLGLAIVTRIVEAHRGTVRVETDPGRGATFTLDLPLIEPPTESPS